MKILKKLIPIFSLLPFVMGAAGYSLAGEKPTDALYASFALYFVNPVSDSHNILIEAARWTAALVTTAAVLYAVRRIWSFVSSSLKCFMKDSIAVYSDNQIDIQFEKPHRGVIYLKNEFKAAAKSQIIMFNSDADNLRFYEQHKSVLKKRKVYIGLKEIQFSALKNNPDVIFFDINNAAARTLWSEIALWELSPPKTKIVILGTNHLGQCILSCGLLMNLFSLEQEIDYYFIGKNDSFRISYGEIKTFNKDRVMFLRPDDDILDTVKSADIVIVSERISIEEKHLLSVICRGKVYCYSPDNDTDNFLNYPNIKLFGKNASIYTDENIRRNKLVNAAIDKNYNYVLSGSNNKGAIDRLEEWNKLDGFLKWSNISSADFEVVLISLCKKGKDTEVLAELEHIRWCRFHILNYWKYGIPENGKNKDSQKKIHSCLCNYSELDEENKNKNRCFIQKLVSTMNKPE